VASFSDIVTAWQQRLKSFHLASEQDCSTPSLALLNPTRNELSMKALLLVGLSCLVAWPVFTRAWRLIRDIWQWERHALIVWGLVAAITMPLLALYIRRALVVLMRRHRTLMRSRPALH
jgi:uncharacterized membrane protein YcjF (UPF0283 family)